MEKEEKDQIAKDKLMNMMSKSAAPLKLKIVKRRIDSESDLDFPKAKADMNQSMI